MSVLIACLGISVGPLVGVFVFIPETRRNPLCMEVGAALLWLQFSGITLGACYLTGLFVYAQLDTK